MTLRGSRLFVDLRSQVDVIDVADRRHLRPASSIQTGGRSGTFFQDDHLVNVGQSLTVHRIGNAMDVPLLGERGFQLLWASGQVDNGRLYAQGPAGLFAVNVRDPGLTGPQTYLPGSYTGTKLIDGNRIYVYERGLNIGIDTGDGATIAEEDLSVDVPRVLAGEKGHHRRDVVRVEAFDVARTPILALDALLLPESPRLQIRVRHRHARARHGRDGIDRDAIAPEIACGHFREAADGPFGRAVVGLAGVAEEARPGRERDDAAVTLLTHSYAGVSQAVEGPLEMRGDHRFPLVGSHVEDHAVTQDAGTGDQDVDATETLHGRCHDALGPAPVDNRVDVRHRLAAGLSDLGDDRTGRLRGRVASVDRNSQVVDDDLRPLRRQLECDAAADAAAGARHHGHPASEHVSHRVPAPRQLSASALIGASAVSAAAGVSAGASASGVAAASGGASASGAAAASGGASASGAAVAAAGATGSAGGASTTGAGASLATLAASPRA
jgi:hypothetical protein